MDIWAARPRDSLVFREISEHDLHLTYTSRRLHVARIVSQLSTFLSRSPLSPAQMSQPLPPPPPSSRRVHVNYTHVRGGKFHWTCSCYLVVTEYPFFRNFKFPRNGFSGKLEGSYIVSCAFDQKMDEKR